MIELTAVAGRFRRLFQVVPLVLFRGLNGGMPILLGLYIGHRWGLTELGLYTLASSFVAIGLMAVDWGCTRWLPRELALERLQQERGSAVATANALRLGIAAAWLLLTWLLGVTGRLPAESVRFAIELGLLYPISIYSVNGVSDRIVSGEVAGIGGAVAAGLGVFALGALLVLRGGASPHALILAFAAGKAVEAALLLWGRPRLFRAAPRHLPAMALALWPFSIQAILAAVYSRFSVFIVEHFRHADIGLFGVATALQNVFLLLPVSISLLKYPVFTTAAAKGEIGRIRSAVLAAAAMSIAAVGAGIVMLVAGWSLVTRVLHVGPSAMPFVVAFASIAAVTTGTVLSGLLLQSFGHERITAKLSFVTVAVSLTAQYTFVKWFGLWGVASGIALAELVSFSIFGTAAIRLLRRKPAGLTDKAVETPAAASLPR